MALEESISRFCIINLSKRFTSIPIHKIASYPRVNFSPDQTLQFVQHLITTGDLNGTIQASPSTGEPVLRFTPASQTTKDTEPKLHTLLAAEVANIQNLADLIRLADAKLLVSRDYVAAHRRMEQVSLDDANGTGPITALRKNISAMESGGSMSMQLDHDDADDEDLMLET